MAASVYNLLYQAYHADKQASRLFHALEELAGRLEAAEGGTECLQASSCTDLTTLPLPDPARGTLPLLPGACEHAALQDAAHDSSRSLRSTAERHAWRRWVMSPEHATLVVHAAWLLVSLVFRQKDACAAALQAHVCQQLQRHHVSTVLSGKEPFGDCSQLWTQTLADAACRLLRAAYPCVTELADAQLQQVLQRQLRLYITGLLPSDAAAPVLRPGKPQQHAAADGLPAAATSAAAAADDTMAAADHGVTAGSRHTAHFVSVKPGAAASAFMSKQGISPAPDLLQAHAGELTRITLPTDLVQHHQQQQLEASAAAAAGSEVPWCCSTQLQRPPPGGSPAACGTAGNAEALTSSGLPQCFDGAGAAMEAPSTSGSRHVSKAAACLAAASSAVAAYEQRKAAAAAVVKAGTLSARQSVQALQRQRARAIAAGRSSARDASNRLSRYLSEAGAATTCLPGTNPAPMHAALRPSASKAAAGGTAGATHQTKSSSSRSSGSCGGSSSSVTQPGSGTTRPPLSTDSQCKAQRYVLEGQLRAVDWRMAHAFNAGCHDKWANLAAAVAVLPPAPVTPMPTDVAAAASGQDWGALVASNVVQGNLSKEAKAGGRSGNSIKVKKAARAIVEDVQRAFAASSSAPFGSSR